MEGKMSAMVSRRGFLGAGAVLAGAAAAGSAVAFADEAEDEAAVATGEAQWDVEADIVVVGTGTAAVAAMAASYYGAGKIVVLEKMSSFGGTTVYSGQGMGVPFNHITHEDPEADLAEGLDQLLLYYKTASCGRADLSVGEAYAVNGDPFLRWLEEAYGITLETTNEDELYGDYYDPCEGYVGSGRNSVSVAAIEGYDEGVTEWAFFREAMEADESIDLRYSTPVTSLITDDDGAVVGVVAEGEDGELRIKADKAVILGTGGFEHDADMRAKYLPFPLIGLATCEGNTGDGQKMGMAIGADVAYMDRCWGLPHVYLGEGDPAQMAIEGETVDSILIGYSEAWYDCNTYRGYPGSVIVNGKGLRIGNECSSYDTYNRCLGNFDSGDNAFTNVCSYLIMDSSYAGPYGYAGGSTAVYTQADTLEELAEALGIDVDNFVKEMEAFNENAANGSDPVFHRGEHDFDINTTGGYMDRLGLESGTSNKVLSPLVTPPYYGVKYVPGTFGTNGGLRIDANSQVLRVDGEVIPGLYAVGNCSSGVAGGIYGQGGFTVGSGSVMSWVAVRHILGIED